MDSPASIWLRSGRKRQYLFKGSRDELIQELKAWVERRKLKKQAHAKLCEEFTQNKESLMAIPQQPGSTQQKSTQISEIMNRFIEGVNSLRVRRPPVIRKLNTDIGLSETLQRERRRNNSRAIPHRYNQSTRYCPTGDALSQTGASGCRHLLHPGLARQDV